MLKPGARLPSWQDLAAQRGVARGTVRIAYEKLAAAQLIEASRATGTRVAQRPRAVVKRERPPDAGSFMETDQEMTQGPALFQMGVPATDTFPAALFARTRSVPRRVLHLSIPILAASGRGMIAKRTLLPVDGSENHQQLLRRGLSELSVLKAAERQLSGSAS